MSRAGVGLGGIVLILAVSVVTGTNPLHILTLLSGLEGAGGPSVNKPIGPEPKPRDQLGRFAAVVLADTEDTWRHLLSTAGASYDEPRLVLYSGAVHSACGTASTTVGPFYCPTDRKVYLDLTFFHDLEQRFGAPGDFAQAYVIAHEIGHHVQHLLGTTESIARLQSQVSPSKANTLSVRMELQADCYAGIWGYHALHERDLIEPGDFEEGLRAASAIGDDRLQQAERGSITPETWTHGSSDQRMTWLRRGLQSGDPTACDTFTQSTE